MATDGAANMEALITSHLQKKIFSEIYIKIQLKFYIFSEKQKKMHTNSVIQTTNSVWKVVHLVQWTTKKYNWYMFPGKYSCVVRGGVV